ncbi:MAG: TrmH family RNA methyltransferase [Bacteroidia bacterium]
MITRNQIKLIQSLKLKKNREEHHLFVVEGKKMVDELINSDFEIEQIYHTQDVAISHKKAIQISKKDLERISFLSSNNEVLALVNIKKSSAKIKPNEITIALDAISDPGNLGTIIRTADWFGVKHIICSENTVDVYNPKVIQASMGSLFRVNVNYVDLEQTLKSFKGNIYGSYLKGNNLYKEKLESGILLIGSESHGISNEREKFVTNKITIPKFGNAESLNAATATAIILSEFKRD